MGTAMDAGAGDDGRGKDALFAGFETYLPHLALTVLRLAKIRSIGESGAQRIGVSTRTQRLRTPDDPTTDIEETTWPGNIQALRSPSSLALRCEEVQVLEGR